MSSTKNNNQHEHMQQQHTQDKEQQQTQQQQQHTQDKDKAFAKSYLETPLANQMDETNKKAMNVWKEGGANAAIKYMMDSAGGDYSRMRSMFG
jgi:hypothetical protein